MRNVTQKKIGRPSTGPHFTLRMPKETIEAIEELAAKKGISRSEAARTLIERGLKQTR